jgi:plasmid stability protein
MSKVIQIRNVPDRVHSKLATRAAREGMSLSGYLKKELERIAARPTMREWLERSRKMKPIPVKRSTAEVLRELREGRR